MMRFGLALVLVAAACSNNSVATPADFTVPHDLAMVAPDLAMSPTACNPVDPMTDGQDCGSGCPMGTVGVNAAGGCKCWQRCEPAMPQVCPCTRRCAPLVTGDGGAAGGACLKANGPGERCGAGGTGPSSEGCAQGLFCVNADAAGMYRYCVYDCGAGQACPTAQTTCLTLTDTMTMMTIGKACAFVSTSTGTAPGVACAPTQQCQSNSVCDTTCRAQCDRAGATCASGTCTALSDGARVFAYVCK